MNLIFMHFNLLIFVLTAKGLVGWSFTCNTSLSVKTRNCNINLRTTVEAIAEQIIKGN
jgi:hypothetical protein